MKPEWCPQWATDEATRVYHSLENSHVLNEDAIARTLLKAHQRGKDESQAEIDRLNKVITRMQKTMSSQAEQWSKSTSAAHREGMIAATELCDAEIARAKEFGPHHIPIISSIKRNILAKAQGLPE